MERQGCQQGTQMQALATCAMPPRRPTSATSQPRLSCPRPARNGKNALQDEANNTSLHNALLDGAKRTLQDCMCHGRPAMPNCQEALGCERTTTMPRRADTTIPSHPKLCQQHPGVALSRCKHLAAHANQGKQRPLKQRSQGATGGADAKGLQAHGNLPGSPRIPTT